MKYINRTIYQGFIVVMLSSLWLLPQLQAVVPAPDGGYPNGNTAEGQNALFSLTTGGYNTAVGYLSLRNNTAAAFNTAVGAGALLLNSTAQENTATGAAALLLNTGAGNSAFGALALLNNADGDANSAFGGETLEANTTGIDNTAMGWRALFENTTGINNTAIGRYALLENIVGNNNVAVGMNAGLAATGSNNVYIGADIEGSVGESNACYIASIFMQTSVSGVPVLINADNKLGTGTSSKRFKEGIKPMDKDSEALYALKPVSFHYKKEIDPAGISQLGLVAEDVEKVNRDLVVHDKEGKPYSVRYEQVNAMLLNEFLKEHRKVEQLTKEFESKVTQQQKQIEALTAGLQKVSAQLEISKTAPQTVLNNR